jgi:hypothetical protein
MSDTQKQALTRFLGALIAEVIGLAIAALSSPDFAALVGTFFGGDALLTGIILALVPPIVLFLGKLQAGATEKVPDAPEGVRGTNVPKGSEPGLFG